MKNLALISILGIIAVGCSSGGDAGDVKTAEAAAANAPKSIDQVKGDIPDGPAKKQAEAAIKQAEAMKAYQDKMNQGMPKGPQ